MTKLSVKCAGSWPIQAEGASPALRGTSGQNLCHITHKDKDFCVKKQGIHRTRTWQLIAKPQAFSKYGKNLITIEVHSDTSNRRRSHAPHLVPQLQESSTNYQPAVTLAEYSASCISTWRRLSVRTRTIANQPPINALTPPTLAIVLRTPQAASPGLEASGPAKQPAGTGPVP
ncbi:hypothetical protein [Stenotrophomonas sp. PS02298]|uniref:hypothetical protein n=1 Tax=Stenotrophomonas sp. PS02298 TaxID=2991424 RepID=UPI00249C3B69|nr:hypothetical protein [Stenotrophomonas sp. PS02298]